MSAAEPTRPGPLTRLHRSLTPRWRRGLRTAQAVVGVLTVTALVDVVLAPSAAADNCSVFTDCFGVANSAIEAAFGLSLLAVLSMVLDFVPVVGTVKGVIEAITGRDLLTGQELAAWERALGVLPLLGGLGALGALNRMARNLPTHVPRGTRYPLPSSTPQLGRYRAPNVTPAQRARLSEEIGEIGGLSYARHAGGNPNLTILRPTSPADVADLVRRFDDGVAWDHAVAFGGRNATNLVYFDGRTLHIIEAKGGSGRYIDRQSSSVIPGGGRIDQTHPEYPRDVAYDMSRSSRTDGRNEIGDVIEEAYAADRVRYVGVRTGPYDQLVNGTPDTVVENVFREPRP